jgi:Flp pilus assembly protein TadG
MKFLKFDSQHNKAQAILEFAIVLPILLLLTYGLIEVGRLLFIYSSVNNAARQAARAGSTSGIDPTYNVPRYQACAAMRQIANSLDFLNAFTDADISIQYYRGAGSLDDAGKYYAACNGTTNTTVNPAQGDRIVVTISTTFTPLVPNLVPMSPRPIVIRSARTLLQDVEIQPPKEKTLTSIISDQIDPSKPNETVTINVTVRSLSNPGTPPTGTVQVKATSPTNERTLECTVTLSPAATGNSASGDCRIDFQITSEGELGNWSLVAYYPGDDTHYPSSSSEEPHTVKGKAIVALTTSPNPSLVNQPVTLTVTSVTEQYSGLSITTGTVTVSLSGAPICTINIAAANSCSYTFTSPGDKLLTVQYSGSTFLTSNPDTVSHTVIQPGQTTTTITTSPSPSWVGQAVTITVNVTSSNTPTGTVAVTSGGTPICTITLSGGTGACSATFNTAGNRVLTATYTPDSSSFLSSSGSVNHSVQLPPTTTTLTTTNTPPYLVGQTINLTFTVQNAPGGSTTTPTGTVTISGQSSGCTSPVTLVNGAGSCTVTFSTPGSKTLTASYSGDAGHASSAGTLTLNVTTAAVTNCNTVSLGLLQRNNGNMTVTINNPLTEFLQIANVTLTWNHDKGHNTGSDKTLRLQSASLGSTFWTGNQSGPTYTITPFSAIFIPPGSSTMIFTFHQSFDRWDDTEQVTINLSTPGCEGVVLFQNQHQ